jgi:hypothetical protein
MTIINGMASKDSQGHTHLLTDEYSFLAALKQILQ